MQINLYHFLLVYIMFELGILNIGQQSIIMSCHYSCITCSASTYLYNCLTCPASRELIGNLCLCKEGYLESQVSQCADSTISNSFVDTGLYTLRIFMDICYFLNIGLFWLFIILTICRVNLPKIRIIILFSQLSSLVLYFPYYQQEVTQKALKSLSALNFDYFTTLISCNGSGMPSVCTQYENLIGPILVLPCFIVAFLIGYLVMNICYKDRLDSPIQFTVYIKTGWLILLFNYVDFTAIYWSLSLTRIVITSNWAFFVIGVFLIILLFSIIKFYKILNSEHQITHMYRMKNNWAYAYDQDYHLYYIDFLYQLRKQEEKQDLGFEIGEDKTVRAFVPHTNILIIEILFKILIASGTVLFYEYKPVLFGISIGILFFMILCIFGVFQTYQNWNFIVYLLSLVINLSLWGLFWTQYYWGLAACVALLVPIALMIHYGVLFCVELKMNEKQINKIYQSKSQQLYQLKDKQTISKENQENRERLSDQEMNSRDLSDLVINNPLEETDDNLLMPANITQNITTKNYIRPASHIPIDPSEQYKREKESISRNTNNINAKNTTLRGITHNVFDPKHLNSTNKNSTNNVLRPDIRKDIKNNTVIGSMKNQSDIIEVDQ